MDDAQQLLAVLRAAGAGGIVRSKLHKESPPELGRARTFRALDYLLANGRAVELQEWRGKQRATVYRAASFAQEAA